MDLTGIRQHAGRIGAGIEKRTDATGRQYELREPRAFLFGLMEPYELATTFLAEHPADDELPVDEAWVKSVLPAKGSPCPGSRESAVYDGNACEVSWIDWGSGLCVYIGPHGIGWRTMSRGQFRALLHGLGIATEAAP